MTISSVTSRNDYTGNDTTATYNYSFKIFLDADLLVTVRNTTTDVETALTLTTDYTVTGAGDTSGGTIVLAGTGKAWQGTGSNLNTGYDLTVRRVVELKQLTDIRNQGDFYPEAHEDQFDKMTMIQQQQQDELDRSVKMPESVPASDFDPTIPAALVGTNSLALVSNATGDGFEVGPTVGEISSAASYAAAAAASAAVAAQFSLETVATESITGGGVISHSNKIRQYRRIDGSGGAVTASTTPFGISPTNFVDGMEIFLIGMDATNTVEIQRNDAQYGCLLNGDIILGRGHALILVYDSTLERFVETYRNI